MTKYRYYSEKKVLKFDKKKKKKAVLCCSLPVGPLDQI